MARTTLGCLLVLGSIAAVLPTAASQAFGRLPDGRDTRLYSLRDADGFGADLCDYGARIVRLVVPDRGGVLADVALGFNDIEGYLVDCPYFGATIGRVANRVADARFVLDGREYRLAANETTGGARKHLHGGVRGFDKVLWAAGPEQRDGRPALRFSYLSPDGDEGYPGAVRIEVLYSLTADRGLRIDYTATTDRPTPINLTNHVYFNLAGEGHGTVLNHEITIHARRFTPIDAAMLPTGVIASVAGTPLDFTRPRRIGDGIGTPHEQMRHGGGYNHNFVLDSQNGSLALAAAVREPTSGRVLEVITTEPGLQFYTLNAFNKSRPGKSGLAYKPHAGLALETEHFPDSVNQPQFPSVILRPGGTFRSTTIFRFPRP